MTGLKVLKLNKNLLTGSIPIHIGVMKELDLLDLSENQFKSTIPTQLGHLTGLETLKLNANQLTGSIRKSSMPYLFPSVHFSKYISFPRLRSY